MTDYAAMTIPDLEREIRTRESAGDFGPEVTAMRVLLEQKRAGVK